MYRTHFREQVNDGFPLLTCCSSLDFIWERLLFAVSSALLDQTDPVWSSIYQPLQLLVVNLLCEVCHRLHYSWFLDFNKNLWTSLSCQGIVTMWVQLHYHTSITSLAKTNRRFTTFTLQVLNWLHGGDQKHTQNVAHFVVNRRKC